MIKTGTKEAGETNGGGTTQLQGPKGTTWNPCLGVNKWCEVEFASMISWVMCHSKRCSGSGACWRERQQPATEDTKQHFPCQTITSRAH